MNSGLNQRKFYDHNMNHVEFDGKPLTWRVSVYVMVVQDNELLIAKNSTEQLCDVIGGRIEFGESIEDAVAREAMEEAGATIKLGALLHAHNDWFYHSKDKKFYQSIQLYYSAELTGDLVPPTEEGMEWVKFVPLTDAGTKYPLPPIVLEVISTYLK